MDTLCSLYDISIQKAEKLIRDLQAVINIPSNEAIKLLTKSDLNLDTAISIYFMDGNDHHNHNHNNNNNKKASLGLKDVDDVKMETNSNNHINHNEELRDNQSNDVTNSNEEDGGSMAKLTNIELNNHNNNNNNNINSNNSKLNKFVNKVKKKWNYGTKQVSEAMNDDNTKNGMKLFKLNEFVVDIQCVLAQIEKEIECNRKGNDYKTNENNVIKEFYNNTSKETINSECAQKLQLLLLAKSPIPVIRSKTALKRQYKKVIDIKDIDTTDDEQENDDDESIGSLTEFIVQDNDIEMDEKRKNEKEGNDKEENDKEENN